MRAKFAPALMVVAAFAVAVSLPPASAQTTTSGSKSSGTTKSSTSTKPKTTSTTTSEPAATPHTTTTPEHPATTSTAEHAAAKSSSGTSKIGPHDFQTKTFYIGPRLFFGGLDGGTAFGAQIERGFTEPGKAGPGIITGGLGVDYYHWSQDYGFGKYSYSVVPIQLFSNYHYILNNSPKIDPYGGLSIVYSIVNSSWEGTGIGASGASSSSTDLAGQVGMQYFFTPKFCGHAQIGFGYASFGIGVSWKL